MLVPFAERRQPTRQRGACERGVNAGGCSNMTLKAIKVITHDVTSKFGL
jgi:hypothetical protein